MGRLSDDLRDMGFVTTGRRSPVDESGILWTNGKEIVCDETGTVIDGNHHTNGKVDDDVEIVKGERVYRYTKSQKVKLPGGYIGSYDWGDEESGFRY